MPTPKANYISEMAADPQCYWTSFRGPWGLEINILADDNALLEVSLSLNPIKDRLRSQLPVGIYQPDHPVLQQAVKQLQEYFAGERREFTTPLRPRGTEFQLRVWEVLKQIPFGRTMSYRDVAARVGNPQAARAVGAANRANPLPLFIPCHRVICSNGSPGGYSAPGGQKLKALLLEHERRFS